MKIKNNKYSSEDSLVEDFCSILKSDEHPWGQLQIEREFDYNRGRTDVVAIDRSGDVIAFEMKLERWRQAVHQAYRNTCFAHRSYVVLPESIAVRAQRSCFEFVRRSVGLCYIKVNTIIVVLPATHQVPLQPWLSRIAVSTVAEKNNCGF